MRAIEEAPEAFARCAVPISHDRFPLDRIATHMLAIEGDNRVEGFEGNFAGLRRRQEATARHRQRIPHCLKYKKFAR